MSVNGGPRGPKSVQKPLELDGAVVNFWFQEPENEECPSQFKRFGSNLLNLMELSSFFGRNRVPGGFQGVLGAAGSFRGQIPARKNIESGLNRLLSQPYGPLLIQSGAVVPPGLWGPLGPPKTAKNQIKTVILGPGPPLRLQGFMGPYGALCGPRCCGTARSALYGC